MKSMNTNRRKRTSTSWDKVAFWYDDLLETGKNYQRDVILPDLLSVLAVENGDKVLDLACGQGFFSRATRDAGADVVGVDISHELIDIARNYEKGSIGQTEGHARPLTDLRGIRSEYAPQFSSQREIKYFTAPSDKLDFIPDGSVDKIVLVLALQNIEKVSETLAECSRVLRGVGSLVIVLNHPALRVLKESSWGFDEAAAIQYRRVNRYMSEFKVAINMHPGEDKSSFTTSFHRPLQFYFKALKGAGFVVRTLHELISNKVSQPGKRSTAENVARKEIPLFMTIEAGKS